MEIFKSFYKKCEFLYGSYKKLKQEKNCAIFMLV